MPIRVLSREQVESLHDVLARTGCQFSACPGPDEEFVDMATCIVCTHEAALGLLLGKTLPDGEKYHESHLKVFEELTATKAAASLGGLDVDKDMIPLELFNELSAETQGYVWYM